MSKKEKYILVSLIAIQGIGVILLFSILIYDELFSNYEAAAVVDEYDKKSVDKDKKNERDLKKCNYNSSYPKSDNEKNSDIEKNRLKQNKRSRVLINMKNKNIKIEKTLKQKVNEILKGANSLIRLKKLFITIIEGSNIDEITELLKIKAEQDDWTLNYALNIVLDNAKIENLNIPGNWLKYSVPKGSEFCAAKIAVKSNVDIFSILEWQNRFDTKRTKREIVSAIINNLTDDNIDQLSGMFNSTYYIDSFSDEFSMIINSIENQPTKGGKKLLISFFDNSPKRKEYNEIRTKLLTSLGNLPQSFIKTGELYSKLINEQDSEVKEKSFSAWSKDNKKKISDLLFNENFNSLSDNLLAETILNISEDVINVNQNKIKNIILDNKKPVDLRIAAVRRLSQSKLPGKKEALRKIARKIANEKGLDDELIDEFYRALFRTN